MNYMAEYERWLASPALTADERAELEAIRGDEDAIKDRFFAPLSFGTAGLRGVLGVGLYRMNRFTVGAATQGLANLIVQNGPEACARGVAIAYDSRHFSPEFAQLAACILAANGISATMSCARPLSCPLPSVTMAPSPASTSPRPTTPKSTTVIRYTGKTAHSCRPRKPMLSPRKWAHWTSLLMSRPWTLKRQRQKVLSR